MNNPAYSHIHYPFESFFQCMNPSGDKSNVSVCPIHSCVGCGEAVTDPSKRKNLVRCFRCPKSYHLRCRPRDLHNLDNSLFLCISHVNEEAELPPLPQDLQKVVEASRHSSKRKERVDDIHFQNGVIVRLDGIAPGTHVFSIKDALKAIGDVRFIEFNENGDDFAIAR
jgi:hypothetical protein